MRDDRGRRHHHINEALEPHTRSRSGSGRPGSSMRFRIADPFHVVQVANRCLDKVRRRGREIPTGDVTGAWCAKESVRDVYITDNPADAELVLDKTIKGCRADWVKEISSLRLDPSAVAERDPQPPPSALRTDRPKAGTSSPRKSNAPATTSGHSPTTNYGSSCT